MWVISLVGRSSMQSYILTYSRLRKKEPLIALGFHSTRETCFCVRSIIRRRKKKEKKKEPMKKGRSTERKEETKRKKKKKEKKRVSRGLACY